MRLLYTILFWLALPIILLRLLVRARFSRKHPYQFRQRMGFINAKFKNTIWVHAVSLGEIIAATPLIDALKQAYPNDTILVTNSTATGRARTLSVFGNKVLQCYLPYDLPFFLKKFFNTVQPRILILIETELWPNLLAECHQRKVPVVLANARLSERSFQGYKRIASLTKEMLDAISLVAAQAESDGQRFLKLGLAQSKLKITGSLKFDLNLPEDLLQRGIALRNELGATRPVWIAASTHAGEEDIMLAAHRMILKNAPTTLLILVPRHPERFDEVASLIQKNNFIMVRRSSKEMCAPETQVYLADSVGEMMLFYAASDMACVAGSFVQVGGHNMIEPAALKKPILTGTVIFNFATIGAEMIEAKGMYQVESAETLAKWVLRFIQDPLFSQQTGEQAYSVVLKNKGALQRQFNLIKAWIN